MFGQLTTRPMSRSIRRFAASCVQHFCLQCGRDHERLLPGMPRLHQAGDPTRQKMILPARDRRSRGIESILNGSVWQAVGEKQNKSSAEDVTSRERSGLSDLL